MIASPRNIRRRLTGRVARLRNRIVRAQHFRGHGVHSPFVYSLVREVFMRRGLPDGDRSLYEALRIVRVTARRAAELQQLFTYCGYATFGVNCAERVDLNVLTCELPAGQILHMVERAQTQGATLCLMEPYDGQERTEMCRRIVEAHPSTSVDNRGYLLLFNNRLPKQHYRL